MFRPSPLRARRLGAAAFAALLALPTGPLAAQTFGDALIDRPFRDTFSEFVLFSLVPSDISSETRRLTSFSVFGSSASNVGATLRPLLLRALSGSYAVVGVGAERTVGAGVNTWAFDVTDGTDLIAANEAFYFGWWNGTAGGAVLYDEGTGSVAYTLSQSYPLPPEAGGSIAGAGIATRDYSIQWTASPFVGDPPPPSVPEPATVGLLALGATLLAARRRERRTTR